MDGLLDHEDGEAGSSSSRIVTSVILAMVAKKLKKAES